MALAVSDDVDLTPGMVDQTGGPSINFQDAKVRKEGAVQGMTLYIPRNSMQPGAVYTFTFHGVDKDKVSDQTSLWRVKYRCSRSHHARACGNQSKRAGQATVTVITRVRYPLKWIWPTVAASTLARTHSWWH